MIWRFTFIDSAATETEVDEPIGWDGVGFSFSRNLEHHGIFNTIDTNGWEWIKDAYNLLNTEYISKGANGQMEVKIEYQCEPTDAFATYFIGKFDFNTFKRQCGDYCFISCDVTSSTCVDIFLSRMGQDVNPDNTTNFDGDTIAACANQDLLIYGQTILLQDNATNLGEPHTGSFDTLLTGSKFIDFPIFLPTTVIAEFHDFNVNNAFASVVLKNSGNTNLSFPMTVQDWQDYGQFLYITAPNLNDNSNCIIGASFLVEWKAKGTFELTPTYNGTFNLILRVFKNNPFTGVATSLGSITVATAVVLTSGVPASVNFDETNSGTVSLTTDEYIYYYFHLELFKSTSSGGTDATAFDITYDDETYFKQTLNSVCDNSHTKSYFLPDLLEHFSKVYYSEDCPQIEIDNALMGCIEQYVITKGSMIREVTEPSAPKLFTSFEYLFSNINKIFNIGWGFDQNDTIITIGYPSLFYQSTSVVSVGVVDKAMFTTAADLIFGSVSIGYNKWEAEEYNGLDEMNTERYYRRNINSNDAEKDLLSDIIAAGYTIEITRRKNQSKTGTSDWRYDDDLFIINCFDDEGQLRTVNGIAAGAANVYEPTTRLNYILTPARNMMRWFASICAANPTIANDSLMFTKGTGNYIAEGQMIFDCALEGSVLSESETIDVSNFTTDPVPNWRTIYATFKAPLGMGQFEEIKANPYGAITFQCGNDIYNGNIVTLNHDPNSGMGDFKLILLPD